MPEKEMVAKKHNGAYRWLKRWWFIIPYIAMAVFTIYSWMMARERTEIRFGDKIQSLDDNYHEMAEDVDTNTREIQSIKEVLPAMQEQMTNIEDKQGDMHDDIKWLIRKNGGSP